MKKLSCLDLGDSVCDYAATGETEEEVKDKMMKHAEEAHQEKLDAMDEEERENLMQMMHEKMATV